MPLLIKLLFPTFRNHWAFERSETSPLTTQRHNHEDRSFQQRRCDNLKCRTSFLIQHWIATVLGETLSTDLYRNRYLCRSRKGTKFLGRCQEWGFDTEALFYNRTYKTWFIQNSLLVERKLNQGRKLFPSRGQADWEFSMSQLIQSVNMSTMFIKTNYFGSVGEPDPDIYKPI
jgi:hypothetical protein